MRRFLLTVVSGVFLLALHAHADGMKHDGIMVEQPWARATAGPARAGAAYMTLVNMGHDTDRLLEVKSDLAARTEVHTHLMEDGIMKMRNGGRHRGCPRHTDDHATGRSARHVYGPESAV